MIAGCCLCDAMARPVPSEVWDTPVLATDDGVVMPTKGSLVDGWVLVVPRRHVLCVGALEISETVALWRLTERVVHHVHSVYGTATVFEHGPAHASGVLGCGVDHVHLHVAPLAFGLAEQSARMFPSLVWRQVDNIWAEASKHHVRGQDYLWVRDERGHTRIAVPSEPTSQTFRRVIAHEVGRAADWDYRDHWGGASAARTVEVWHVVGASR